MTAVEEIRRAAEAVREVSAKATPGPWVAAESGMTVEPGAAAVEQAHPSDASAWPVIADPIDGTDAAWIALMGPDVGPLLAAWLDSVADALHLWGLPESDDWPESTRRALALARRINGGAA